MDVYCCDGCGLGGVRVEEVVLVGERFPFCVACAPVCCVCHRSSTREDAAARGAWRVNGFRINNRQFICGRCRWRL